MMARRRTPNAPPVEAQKAAFYAETGGKHYSRLHMSDQESTPYDDIRWVLVQHKAAEHHNTSSRDGAPPKLDRLIAATIWLEQAGVKLSDAPNSLCVKELVLFLHHWETDHPSKGKKRKNGRYTAETLAGTLRAYSQGLVIQK